MCKAEKTLSTLKIRNFPSERNGKIVRCGTEVEGTRISLVDEQVPY